MKVQILNLEKIMLYFPLFKLSITIIYMFKSCLLI